MAAMKDILWDEEKGAWFDYDLENGKKNLEFYPSNLAPLWAGCFSDPGDVDKALKYLEVRGQLGRWLHWRQDHQLYPSLCPVTSGKWQPLPPLPWVLPCGSHCSHQGAAASQEEKAQERNIWLQQGPASLSAPCPVPPPTQ